MRNYGSKIFMLLLAAAFVACENKPDSAASAEADVESWITTGDKSALLKKTAGISFTTVADSLPVIEIDTTQKFQTIDGFGFSLTGGSAYHINRKLNAAQREALLKELFLTDGENIGISYLRVSIGASDLDDHVFSYADLPAGKTDKTLESFSIAEDKKNLVPVLKEILKLNPAIKIMGSPWSPPVWMKTNNSPKGGSLRPEFYETYANYFVKYIQAMEAEGIAIDAITLQNEPEHPGNKPSMLMTAEEQALFVKKHLGPAFETAGIKTKIVVYDHNCDHPNYPITVLNDAEARKYIDGSAFHLYLGDISALSEVHEAHPDKNIYFTEQWTSPKGTFDGDLRWHTKELIVGATRNWSRTVLEWNLAADADFNPHTDEGGCTMCMGALTIGDSVSRNVSYYIIGQASKFVRPGSVRIASNTIDMLPNVAFITPDGKKVLVVVNDSNVSKKFAVKTYAGSFATELDASSVGTFVW
jgi:glucosylceramidase